MQSTRRKDYLKGYHDGLVEAWNESLKLAAKDYTGWELQVRLKSFIATVDRRIATKEISMGAKDKSASEDIGIPFKQDMTPKVKPKLKETKNAERHEIQEGHSYIVREEKPDQSFRIFASLVENTAGLCIARTNPEKIKETFPGGNIKIFWLSRSEGKKRGDMDSNLPPSSLGLVDTDYPTETSDDIHISPSNLPRITTTVKEFLDKNDNGAVLLEGLEYLITQNDFRSVLKFVQLLNEYIVEGKGYFIVPFDAKTLEEKDWKLLRREMSEIIE